MHKRREGLGRFELIIKIELNKIAGITVSAFLLRIAAEHKAIYSFCI